MMVEIIYNPKLFFVGFFSPSKTRGVLNCETSTLYFKENTTWIESQLFFLKKKIHISKIV